MTEKKWGIILEWHRGTVSDNELEACLWSENFPTYQERISRKKLMEMSLEELQAELEFHYWWEKKFGPSDDDGTVRNDCLLGLIRDKEMSLEELHAELKFQRWHEERSDPLVDLVEERATRISCLLLLIKEKKG